MLALLEANAVDELDSAISGKTGVESALEADLTTARAEPSPLVDAEGGVVVNRGTTLIGTLTACDLLRAGISAGFELARLDVNSAKVLMSRGAFFLIGALESDWDGGDT